MGFRLKERIAMYIAALLTGITEGIVLAIVLMAVYPQAGTIQLVKLCLAGSACMWLTVCLMAISVTNSLAEWLLHRKIKEAVREKIAEAKNKPDSPAERRCTQCNFRPAMDGDDLCTVCSAQLDQSIY